MGLLLLAWLGCSAAQPARVVFPVPVPGVSAVAPLVEHPEGRERLWRELVTLFAANYWDPGHLDWQAWGERHRLPVREAASRAAFDAALARMVREVADGHSSYLGLRAPPGVRLVNPASPSASPAPAWEARMVAEGVGLLVIRHFQPEGLAVGVHAALRALQAQGADALLLDLRGNGGGRLLEAGLVAGIFLTGVWTQAWDVNGVVWEATVRRAPGLEGPAERLLAALGAAGGSELGYAELGAPVAFSGPLVVLVDRATASAAELLAVALVESGRAQALGEVTAGNVEAVRPFLLSDGSQVLVAIAQLRSARGVVLDGGLQPVKVWPAALDDDLGVREGLRLLGRLPFTPGRWFAPPAAGSSGWPAGVVGRRP